MTELRYVLYIVGYEWFAPALEIIPHFMYCPIDHGIVFTDRQCIASF